MVENQEQIIHFYKKRIEPYLAIFILAFLLVGLYLLYEDNQLQKEISLNCGYETKAYVCYCEKSVVEEFKIGQIQNGGMTLNVSVDRWYYEKGFD